MKGKHLRNNFKTHCRGHGNEKKENYTSCILNRYSTKTRQIQSDESSSDDIEFTYPADQADGNQSNHYQFEAQSMPSASLDVHMTQTCSNVNILNVDNFHFQENPALLRLPGVTNGTKNLFWYEDVQQARPTLNELRSFFCNWSDTNINAHDLGFLQRHAGVTIVYPEKIDEDLMRHGMSVLLPQGSYLPANVKVAATKLYKILMKMLFKGKRLTRTNQKQLVEVIQTTMNLSANAESMQVASTIDLKNSKNTLEKNIQVFEQIQVSVLWNKCDDLVFFCDLILFVF